MAGDALARLISEYDTPDTIYIVNSWFQILSPSIFGPLSKVSHRLLIFAHDFFLACPNGAYFDFKRDELCDRIPLSNSCLLTNCDKRFYLHKLWRVAVATSRRRTLQFAYSAAKVIAVHEGMIEYLVKAGIHSNAVRVLRNPSTPYTLEHIHVQANNEILYVGSLSAQKGFDLVFALAREREWTINAFGEGELSSLCGSAPTNLKLYGYQPHSVICEAAKRSRLLVMPSRQRETFGLAAAEALGSGLPIIVTDQCMISNDVRKHACGLVMPSASIAELAEAADKMFSDDKLVASFGANGRNAAANISLSYSVWTDEIINLCRSTLENSNR